MGAPPIGPDELAAELTVTLAGVADPGRAEQERRYLRSDLDHLGVSVPAIRRSVRAVLRHHPLGTASEVVGFTEELWDRPTPAVHERRMAAVEVLERSVGVLGIGEVALLERLLREARTWALVDGLAVSVVGPLSLADPDGWDPVIRGWATDDDHWVRRASLLVHLTGIRAGDPDVDRFLALADPMLEEREPFIRKAIGWVLRELGARQPGVVVAWLEPRLQRASGLTVREAVKRLPADDRDRLLAVRG